MCYQEIIYVLDRLESTDSAHDIAFLAGVQITGRHISVSLANGVAYLVDRNTPVREFLWIDVDTYLAFNAIA